jgi:hypothetical protein
LRWLDAIAAKSFANRKAHRAISWRQNPSLVDQLRKLDFATTDPFVCFPGHHEMPVVKERGRFDILVKYGIWNRPDR